MESNIVNNIIYSQPFQLLNVSTEGMLHSDMFQVRLVGIIYGYRLVELV